MLCISWIIKCFIISDARCKHENWWYRRLTLNSDEFSEFRESSCSKSVNEILPIYSHLSSNLDKIRYRISPYDAVKYF